MDQILGNFFYSWFNSFFSSKFLEYLWGFNCEAQKYDSQNLYNLVGLITIVMSFVFVCAYYYLPLWGFNHPRTNRWWNWTILLLITGIINLFIGYLFTINDFMNGNIGDCLMYERVDGVIVKYTIVEKDCWLFGLSNFNVSVIFFILWSSVFKWWSRNCKHSPLF